MRNFFKISLIIVSILLISLFIIKGFLISNNISENNDKIKPNNFTYLVQINLSSPCYFNINVPLAIYENGTVHELMDDLQIIKGDGNIAVIKTDKGFALEISGYNNLTIENSIHVDWYATQYPILSLRNNTKHYDYLVFLNNLSTNKFLFVKIYMYIYTSSEVSHRQQYYLITDYIRLPLGEKNFEGDYSEMVS